MLGFGKKQQALLGVDFSAASVKVLELARGSGGFRVESFAVEPLPEGAVIEKETRDAGAVGVALANAIKRSGTRLKHCAMAVPASTIISRTIRLPSYLSHNEMEGQVMVEADQYIPYNIEDVALDFEVQGKNEANPELADVMVVASRREYIEARQAIAEAAKVELDLVDVESFAIERAVDLMLDQIPDRDDRPTVAVIDMGHMVTNVYVFHRDKGVIYTREQDFGGHLLTEDIMRHYGKDRADAGRSKVHGDLPEDYGSEVLEPFKQNMLDQVQRLLQYFYATRPNDIIDQIFLGGGCAAVQGIAGMLEEATSTPVATANPFLTMPLGRRVNPERFQNDAPASIIACGLAMRGFRT